MQGEPVHAGCPPCFSGWVAGWMNMPQALRAWTAQARLPASIGVIVPLGYVNIMGGVLLQMIQELSGIDSEHNWEERCKDKHR